ncbi:MAG: hypothetical protein JNJ54_23215 [Myxococcaceae bacterium]|nr:hypothetical protein [Myxococcaceae bacterium]
MSRDDNDALEAAQAKVRGLNERLDEVLATTAGLALQRERLSARLGVVTRRRRSLLTALDERPGSGVLAVVGFCVGALLARGGWELRPHLLPDARALLGGLVLATSLALFASRTHWFRSGLGGR